MYVTLVASVIVVSKILLESCIYLLLICYEVIVAQGYLLIICGKCSLISS